MTNITYQEPRKPFGADRDLILWFGPASVSSMTKTNGDFAITSDGRHHLNQAPGEQIDE